MHETVSPQSASPEAMSPRGVSPETMLPDLFSRYPQTRAVLDRYGLHGCGGRGGPVESVGFFARAHGVELEQLLAEINSTIHQPAEEPFDSPPGIADTIYRRFFTAGIAVVLTLGATWGAWLLWKIGIAGTFTGVSIHEVNAHGHAQIFGWVGLFIMGFAYQAFPRMWHTHLVAPRLAAAVFPLMLIGLTIRTIGMALAGSWSWALPATVAGGVMEIAAISIFAAQIVLTFRRGDVGLEPYVGFAVAALTFFVLQAVASLWHSWNTMTAGSREELLWYVATYQAPLRDLQIHGLAMLMILGVSIRMVPALFGVDEVPRERAWKALAVLVAGVVLETALFVAYRWTERPALALGVWGAWALLAVGAGAVALPWKLWRPLPESDRSGKFIRAAYGWLGVSLAMLLLMPAYQVVSGEMFSHAYYGATRHAITVGFISLMIMGFAAKVVPTLNGIDTRERTALWGPFVLVNVGCLLRVTTQTLTDWHSGLFSVVGFSGMLEVTGLAWWGAGLIRIIVQGKREQAAMAADGAAEAAAAPPERIDADHTVARVLAWHPQTLEVFLRHGFAPLRNPILRRTVARRATIRHAARIGGVSLEALLADLNHAADNRAPGA